MKCQKLLGTPDPKRRACNGFSPSIFREREREWLSQQGRNGREQISTVISNPVCGLWYFVTANLPRKLIC